jgi:predicted RecB family nuclease
LAPAIAGVIDRFIDLITPFRSRAVYDWQMAGSASLKAVLPALIPDLSYDELEVADGGAASAAWLWLRESADAAERETLRQGLLTYCHLDTLAMVRILEWLRERAG